MSIFSDRQRLFLKIRSVRECSWMRHSRVGYSLDGFELTEQAGAYALAVTENDDWYTDQPLALVSSLSSFWTAELLGQQEPIGGYVHVEPDQYQQLVAWLQRAKRSPKLYLYFDYDTQGVELMDRIISWVPEAQVFLPFNFAEVWAEQRRINHFNPVHFDAIRTTLQLQNPAVQTVFRAISKDRAGMKLDALLLAEKEETFN